MAVLELSRFVSYSHESHWNLLKGVVKYLKGKKETGLLYAKENKE